MSGVVAVRLLADEQPVSEGVNRSGHLKLMPAMEVKPTAFMNILLKTEPTCQIGRPSSDYRPQRERSTTKSPADGARQQKGRVCSRERG